MIVTYLRSSSIGTFNNCQFKYFLVYNMGLKDSSNKAAMKGVIFHKVMEVYAQISLARKKNKKKFNEEAFGRLDCNISKDEILDLCWQYYTENSDKKFYPADKRDISNWIDMAIDMYDGLYNPLNMDIKAHELFFDIEVKQDWAKYRYMIDNKWMEGQLRLKGTIDLVINNDKSLEIVDWKTGARKDWKTGEKKTYKKLSDDHQLLLYYYVVRNLYPEAHNVSVTIVYVKDGGAYTLNFDDEDYQKAEQIIKQQFEDIRKCYLPKTIYPHDFCNFCAFNKEKIGNKSVCKHYHDELVQIGMGDLLKSSPTKHIFEYQDGGGRYGDST